MIPVKQVSVLTLKESGGDERSRHISAASGLVRVGELLYAVADDALQLAIFGSNGRDEGTLVQLLEGSLPADPDERKEEKADLESLVVLPAADDWPHGAILALGSGSGEKRNRGAVVALGEDGLPSESAVEVDLTPLFDHLRESISELNIEGAVIVGEHLWLLQRGDNADVKNGVIRIDLPSVLEGARGRALKADGLVDIKYFDDLGRLKGVDLAFSDASILEDGRIAVSASAEDSSGGSDGGYVGSAVGIMTPDREVGLLEPIDLDVKLEGMTARIDGDEIVYMLVTDADDPSVPSPLLEARIPASS